MSRLTMVLLLVVGVLSGCVANTNTRIDYERIARNEGKEQEKVVMPVGVVKTNQAIEGEAEEVVEPVRVDVVKMPRVEWPVGSDDMGSEMPHVVFGEPRYDRHQDRLMTVRKYHGFSVYYDGQAMGPRWTAIKLTAEMADANGDVRRVSKFKKDKWLERSGFAVSSHQDYNNEKGKRVWDRGHMVQFDDARGWGMEAGRDSFYTSNVWPQVGLLNRNAWLRLEEVCTEYARDYGVVWVFTGPVFKGEGVSMGSGFLPGRKVWKPDGFYKVVVKKADDGGVEAVAFYLPNEERRESGMDLGKYVVSVDEVEAMTGLDFLHELNDVIEQKVEAKRGGMWEDVRGGGKGF